MWDFAHVSEKNGCLQLFFYNSHYFHKILLSLHQNLSLYTIMAKLNRIKAVLAEQEKTSKWLAEQVGKSACTVSKWCNNVVQPDLNTLDKIAKLLDIDVKELLNSTEK